MAKSLSKTPAPKKDRIFGSDKNKKGSASSKASAKGIELNDSIIETLTNKAKEYNEKHPNKRVSVATLKAVMRRGMGAYSTSHRPTITGGSPNSRQAWGFARVNKFLKKKAGQQVKAAYVQDDDLMAKGGQTGQAITCVNCGWHWNTADSDESDKYICHKCGFDNRTFYDPEPIGVMADGGVLGVPSTENLIELVRKERENKIREWNRLGYRVVVGRNDGYYYNKESERDTEFIDAKNPSERKVTDIIKNNPDISEIGFNGTIKAGKRVGEELEIADDFSVVLWKKDDSFFKEGLKFEFVQDGGKYINTIVNKNDTITYKDRQDDGKYVYFKQLDVKYNTESESRSKKDLLKEEFDNKEAIFIKDKYADGGEVDYTKDALEFFKKELGIKSDVVLVQSQSSFDPMSMSQLMGSVTPKKNNKFYVAVNFNETKNRFIRVLAHELVHVKQMEDERLRFEGDKIIFGDEKMTYDEYQKRYYSDDIPKFEDEAFTLERVLQNKYAEKEGSYADGGVMGQELFKPSKTIEQIAKEKDVPLEYAEEQLRKGMKTESEHSDNPMVQETIALQHLDEMIDYYEKLEYIENQNKMAQGDLLNKSLFNKALIYKSIKPIREANEIMQRLDYMESQNKMANGGVTKFYKEYLDWYINGVCDKMTIMVSVPNALSKMSGGDNDVILDVFEKKDENVNAKEKMKELLEIVDRNGLDIYLEPIPRLYNIKDKAKRDKITREYLIKYYENFGFELLSNGFMVRKHNKMEKGGYYKAGGEINPDNKAVKDYFSHGSGNVGGVLVGKRHSEGGIKAVNKSTNQPLEMEGGEVVITRNAVSDNTKREFNGEMLTNREILSKINESGGGVSFADGGDIPETITTSGKEYKYGGKMMKDHEIVSSCGCNHSMADGGETDYHTEIKNHLFPKVEVEVEVEVETEMDVMPIHEHYITADDLGLSEGMPMLAVGTIIYSSGGNDQWEVVSFSDDGVNLVNNPKSPLQSKMEDKHLTFDELIKYFKDKAISIKNISTERELEPAIALVKNKLPQKSFAVGGLIDGDEDEDAKIMQSQFGKSNFK
jgi:hypothetical protein